MKRFRTAMPNIGWVRTSTAGIGLAALVVAGVMALWSGPAVAGIAAPGSSPTLANPTLKATSGGPLSTTVKQIERAPIKPTRQRVGYYHSCPPGYDLPGGRGQSAYLPMSRPVTCSR